MWYHWGMSTIIAASAARAQLYSLLQQAQAGGAITIRHRGQPDCVLLSARDYHALQAGRASRAAWWAEIIQEITEWSQHYRPGHPPTDGKG